MLSKYIRRLRDRFPSPIYLPFNWVIVNRGYLIGNKWLRFERGATGSMRFKIAIGIYEFRKYNKKTSV